ncbi:MAG: hypothetical protein ACM31C_22005 [Acidobacteriota bacterium]
MSLLVLAAASTAPVSPTDFSEILAPVEMPADAIADPCTPAPDTQLRCTTIASKKLAGIGRVDIRRSARDDQPGYGIEIVIVTDHDGMFVLPMIGFGEISDLTKTNEATGGLSVDIRALKPLPDDPSGTGPAVGIELAYAGALSPNWKDTFKGYVWRGSIWIACEPEDGGVACKALQVGGAFGHCRATGWRGRDVQLRCEHAVHL